MRMTQRNHKKSGHMMIEILVALSIIVIAILSFMNVVQKAINLSVRSVHSTQAAFLLEEGAEAVRVVRDNAWANISGLTNGTNYYPTFSVDTWTLSSTSNTVGIFTRTVSIASVNRNSTTQDISSSGTNDAGTKLVTVTVSWVEAGTTISKTLSFYITDIFS
jgi:Tfp pilus assembly protein PilV